MSFLRFKDLEVDPDHGNPRSQLGAKPGVGLYWSVPVGVEVKELVTALRPRAISRDRSCDIRRARAAGVVLDPIEIGVYRSGNGWLIDGHHRLVEARRRRDSQIQARFTFEE